MHRGLAADQQEPDQPLRDAALPGALVRLPATAAYGEAAEQPEPERRWVGAHAGADRRGGCCDVRVLVARELAEPRHSLRAP